MRTTLGVLMLFGMLTFASAAVARAPRLCVATVDHRGHPAIRFLAWGAGGVVVYIFKRPAGSPAVSDPRHLVVRQALTRTQIKSGKWVGQHALEPGRYSIRIIARFDFTFCQDTAAYPDPSCANGPSNVLPLTVQQR